MYLPACEDGTQCSEMLAYKIQTPGNYTEESIQQENGYQKIKLWNSSEEDGNVKSQCKENGGTDCEDGDSDTDW